LKVTVMAFLRGQHQIEYEDAPQLSSNSFLIPARFHSAGRGVSCSINPICAGLDRGKLFDPELQIGGQDQCAATALTGNQDTPGNRLVKRRLADPRGRACFRYSKCELFHLSCSMTVPGNRIRVIAGFGATWSKNRRDNKTQRVRC
jgi:hypothetical protein